MVENALAMRGSSAAAVSNEFAAEARVCWSFAMTGRTRECQPSIDKAEHALAIDDRSNLPDLDAVLATHEFYRLRKAEAQAERDRLRGVLRSWERRARALGLSAEDRLALRSGLSSLTRAGYPTGNRSATAPRN